jgi:hypothetical protein
MGRPSVGPAVLAGDLEAIAARVRLRRQDHVQLDGAVRFEHEHAAELDGGDLDRLPRPEVGGDGEDEARMEDSRDADASVDEVAGQVGLLGDADAYHVMASAAGHGDAPAREGPARGARGRQGP